MNNNNSIFQNQLLSQFEQFRSNPANFLLSRNVNIPQEYLNNPQAAINYLVQTGRLSPDTLTRFQEMASKMNIPR